MLRSAMPRQAAIPTIRRPVGPIGSLRQKAWPKPKADRPSAPNDGESLAGIYWRLKATHERPELPAGRPSLPTPEQPAALEDAIEDAIRKLTAASSVAWRRDEGTFEQRAPQ